MNLINSRNNIVYVGCVEVHAYVHMYISSCLNKGCNLNNFYKHTYICMYMHITYLYTYVPQEI